MTAAAVVVSFVVNLGLPAEAVAEEKDEDQEELEDASSALGRFGREVSAGFKTVASDSRLVVLLGIFAGGCMLTGAMEVVIVSIAFDLLHAGDGAVGYLNAAFGIGAIIGAFVVAGFVGARRLSRPFIAGALLCGAPLIVAASPTKGARSPA